MGIEDLHAAHQKDDDAQHVDPVRCPHPKRMTVDQFPAAPRLSRRLDGLAGGIGHGKSQGMTGGLH